MPLDVMKTLHTYLTRQVVASLLITVCVFTFVLLLANVLKDVLPLLISGQVRFGVLAEAIGLLIPFVWVFALPMGLLTATLLIFGRFSADQELTAVRASGISLLSVISPILLLSLALCGVSAIFNMYVGPTCRVAYTTLLSKIKSELAGSLQIPEGQYVTASKSTILYVGKNKGGALEDIMVYYTESSTNGVPAEIVFHAPRGKYEYDAANRKLVLHLYDSKSVRRTEGKTTVHFSGSYDVTMNLEDKSKAAQRPKVSDMTFLELRDELRDVERRMTMHSVQRITNSAQVAEA